MGELSRCDKVRLIKAAMAFEMAMLSRASHYQTPNGYVRGTPEKERKGTNERDACDLVPQSIAVRRILPFESDCVSGACL